MLAANVDLVATVHGVDRPLAPGRIERLVVLAEDSGATPLVVLTKIDLVGPDEV
ncbi:MAG: GTPase RsgA, partial [Actinomyces sp.]